ncbi:MAG TPA: hypothetical protein VMC79_10090 [Rectinemataceae bacterium]|nr:hypothetical protein [Rectinemataceae bacterium]
MAQGMIQKLIATLIDIAEGMGLHCEPQDMERMAVLVHRVMSYQARQFHTLEHVFGFLDGADEITALAAIFHDLIYYQVDDGLPEEVGSLLGPYIEFRENGLALRSAVPAADLPYHVCRIVFGFDEGEDLRLFGGLNEFLSALVMAILLKRHVSPTDTASVAVCIESSIPFRDDAGQDAIGMALETRLKRLAEAGLIDASAEDIVTMVRRATAFGNTDVRDFSLEDPGRFLANTWKLLPESNASLRSKGTFSIREYRVALEKMQAFLGSLKPSAIYHAYRGRPSAEEMSRLGAAAHRNLGFAQTYMRAKLLAVGLVEATAELTGGDAPMALFMGDVPHDGSEYAGLMEFLPDPPAPPWLDTGNPVYRLLRDGRLDESSFDLKNSPLALHLYHRLQPAQWGAQSRAAQSYFEGTMKAADFLRGFDPGFLADFLRALATMLPTRKSALGALTPTLVLRS